MATRDPRVTAYIAARRPFARPILKHLRALVHEACPDVVETIKWGMPAFECDGPLCGMSAFQAHAAFYLWRGSVILPGKSNRSGEAMGQYGRLTSLADLPPDRTVIAHVRAGVKLNRSGEKAPPRRAAKPRPRPGVPADLAAALAKAAKARAFFASLPPGQQREYVEWITGAKQDATRARRLATTVEWLGQGKRRNWKYEKC